MVVYYIKLILTLSNHFTFCFIGDDGIGCTVKESKGGAMITCGGDEEEKPSMVEILNGESCQLGETKEGVSIKCPDSEGPVVIKNGINGTSCSVTKQGHVASIKCGNEHKEPVYIQDGKNGTSCTATEIKGGVSIDCPENEKPVYVMNGENGKFLILVSVRSVRSRASVRVA